MSVFITKRNEKKKKNANVPNNIKAIFTSFNMS